MAMSQSPNTLGDRFRLVRKHRMSPRVSDDPSGPPSWVAIKWKCLAVFAVLGVLGSGPAEGAVGDMVRTVTLPAEINCAVAGVADHVAISVAIVPASDVGITGMGNKVLLATSCRSAQGNTIYFLDPGSSDTTVTNLVGAIVQRLTVDFTPPNGWGALAFRGDVD